MSTIILITQIVTLLAIGYIVKSYLPSYFTEKGKNLATKEDIEEITRKVENVKADVMHITRVDETKYRLKYDAYLEALFLVDAHFSHVLSSPDGTKPVKQYSTTEDARSCHNKLILSCDNNEILKVFYEIMFPPKNRAEPQKAPTDLLNDFRNLIRRELGFGQDLELDREIAWFGRVGFEPESKAAANKPLKSDAG